MRNRKPITTLVPVAAAFACLLAASHFGDALAPSRASAFQPGDSPFNATAQRRDMLEQLRQMNERLTRIESKLERGINVKVTEMPPVTVQSKD